MSFDDVKDQIEKEIKVNIALEKMYELGNMFYDELAMGNNITDAASSINAKVRDINFIDNKGIDINGDIVEDLPPFPELIDTVFSTNDNDTSDIINTISNIMYAIQINEIKPQRTMNLNEAKNKIIENFKNRENMTIAKKYAEQFYLDITNGANFNELSKKYNLVIIESPSVKRDGTGSEGVVNSEAIDKIFSLKVNEITSPTIYNNSYTISKITQIIPTNTDSAEDIDLINSNIINDIRKFFLSKSKLLKKYKIPQSKVYFDPGIGFGKNLNQNLDIIKNINKFKIEKYGLLVGTSRKSWISKIDNSLINQRLGGSIASVIYCLEKGVDIFRVHDVQETKQAINIYKKILCLK